MEYTKILYDEHEVIISAVEMIESSESLLNDDPEKWKVFCKKMIYFFRNYADKYHHHKEEQLLFPKISQENEVMGMNIIAEMLENHNDFRDYLSEIEECLNSDISKAFLKISDYCEHLSDHISVENEELFISVETLLSENDLETMMYQFQDIDRDLGEVKKKELEESLEEIKQMF
ncbi:MAG: hemerythrin domain-containing protein [Flavobacteriales bacterium]|nr:hemerythrin domain-containing protein [Flavobacteriales bacterium]